MAANILARHFKVPFSDYYSIDVSADVHVRRVFGRLGLVGEDASVEQIVYRARDLHPVFPALLDRAAYWAGKNWCRPLLSVCSECDLSNVCPTAARRRTSDPGLQRTVLRAAAKPAGR
jgi:endonuclease-3